MHKIIITLIAIASASLVSAQPSIEPTTFLDLGEPDKICQSYIDDKFGEMFLAFVQPTGGALARIDIGGQYYCMYFFCDPPLNRILCFRLFDDGITRTPESIIEYGHYVPHLWFEIVHEDSLIPDTITPPTANRDSVGCFFGPVDVAVSSCGREFNPDEDHIFILDEGNRRIVKLRYDMEHDTLIWIDHFGQNVLWLPTSIDYADYGDSDPANDDIYVTDGATAKIYRFSVDGELEAQYGGFGSNFALIGYPTGIAVSTDPELPDRFYLSDSKNHRVTRYYSTTDGPIMVERQFAFAHFLPQPYTVPFLSALDTDSEGNVYVVDKFSHMVTVISSDLNIRLKDYGNFGFEQGEFNYPEDIYIDCTPGNDELTICERWQAESGIQSFKITHGFGKGALTDNLPRKFQLYQNFPNPFNSRTTISFDLPDAAVVKIEVYNILGQKVKKITDNYYPAGHHSITWDGKNESGSNIASGIYLYKIETSNNRDVKKLLLLK